MDSSFLHISKESYALPFFDFIPDEILFKIFVIIPYYKSDWFHVILTCKRFYTVGDIVFDPSVKYQTPIRMACLNGKLECVRKLLRDDRVDPSALGNRCIKYAAERGHIEIVKALLERKEVDPSADKNYALRFSSLEGHAEIVELLLQDKRVRNMRDERHFFEALEFACERGHLETLRVLLMDKRVHDTERENNRGLCLWQASRSGHNNIAKLMMKHNVPKRHIGDAFLVACMYGHYKIAKRLMKHDVVVAEAALHDALLNAIRHRHLPLCQLLLSHPKLDPSMNKNAALKLAISTDFAEMVTILSRLESVAFVSVVSRVEEVQ